jgi:hypothetical protein
MLEHGRQIPELLNDGSSNHAIDNLIKQGQIIRGGGECM